MYLLSDGDITDEVGGPALLNEMHGPVQVREGREDARAGVGTDAAQEVGGMTKEWWLEKFGIFVEPMPMYPNSWQTTYTDAKGQKVMMGCSTATWRVWSVLKEVVTNLCKA